MWGVAPNGDLVWGGFPLMNVPSMGHGHVFAAGKPYQAYIRALIAQEMQRSVLNNTFKRQTVEALQNTATYRRMQMVVEMERKITERDADDLFLVLSV